MNANIWLWATEAGEQHAGGEQELVTCLQSRALPPYTLVWRSGWGEWLPAMQVSALARGLPDGNICAPRAARATAPGVPPPPPPIESYPVLRRWAEELQQASGPITRREGEVPVWAQTVVLNESPVAIEPDETTDEIPLEILQEAARLMMVATPPADLGIEASMMRGWASAPGAGYVVADPLLGSPEQHEPVSLLEPNASDFSVPEMPAPMAQEPHDEGASSVDSVPRAPLRWLWLMPLATVAGVLWFFRSQWLPEPPVTSPEPYVAVLPVRPAPTLPEPMPVAPKIFGCRFTKQPQKLDDWAIPDVALGMAVAPDTKRIALGYAQSHERAIGISFDPSRFEAAISPASGASTNADVDTAANADVDTDPAAKAAADAARIRLGRDFMQYRDEQIYSVTPLAASGKLEFRVERVGEKLALGTAIDGVPTLRVGMNEFGIVGGLLGRRPHRIWWLPRPALTSVPAYTRHPLGYLIAARVGRRDPSIRVGVISPEAAPHTSLSQVELPQGPLGVPVLAGKATVMALAVVVETERGGAADRLMLARATPTELPLTAQPLQVFGNAAVQLSSPALAALGAEGFALSWSEGVGEQRRVRFLLLDDELAPRGEPFEMPLPGIEQRGVINGALLWANDRLLSFFYLRRPEGYSLWANELSCSSGA